MTAGELAQSCHRRWLAALGPADEDTPAAANNLAVVRWALGDYERARALDEDTLARRQRVLGDDHPDTLESADNLEALDGAYPAPSGAPT